MDQSTKLQAKLAGIQKDIETDEALLALQMQIGRAVAASAVHHAQGMERSMKRAEPQANLQHTAALQEDIKLLRVICGAVACEIEKINGYSCCRSIDWNGGRIYCCSDNDSLGGQARCKK